MQNKKGILAILLIAVMVLSIAVVTAPNAYATATPGQSLVVFKESGLATGTTWSVDFNGNTQSSATNYDNISVTENGTYSFTIINPNGYSASPSAGTIAITQHNVAGATNVTEPITFTPTARTYPVAFVTSTLASGEIWSVTVNGVTETSNTNTITFNEPNGTYSFNIPDVGHWYAIPFSGSFTVAGNKSLPAWMHGTLQNNITFKYGYLVTFTASGLPKYVPWSVELNGTTNSTIGTSSSITFSIANGTNYAFSVSIAPDWQASPVSGTLSVSGAPVTETITFTEVFYKIIFVETGLPSGTAWIININGVPYPTTNGTVVLTEHNGTFEYTAESEPGYTATPASGTVTLQYSDISVHIVYSASTIHTNTTGTGGFIIPKSFTSFFSEYGFYVLIVIIILLIAGMFAVKGSKKSRKRLK
ncbi:MAG: hypothetical protein QXV17_04360 [Candidatus Micrarchaeaceae archaeon]